MTAQEFISSTDISKSFDLSNIYYHHVPSDLHQPTRFFLWKQKMRLWRPVVKGSQVALVLRNPPANAREMGSIPVSGRSPGEGNGNPLQYFCLENPKDRGAWWATVHGIKTEQLNKLLSSSTRDQTHISCIGSHGVLITRLPGKPWRKIHVQRHKYQMLKLYV